MKVFVTGASGLLGSNVVRELIAQNFSVRAMVEKGKPYPTIHGLPIEIVEGNILDPYFLKNKMAGYDYVIHSAASTAVYPFRSARQWEINVTGTVNVAEACLANHVKRMVYVGTANSFGAGTLDRPGTETNSYTAFKYGLDYTDSKYEAHRTVLRMVAENDLDAVIVNPTFMIGPYDSGPSSGAMILAVAQRKLPGFSPGRRNYLHVKDAAAGVVAALQKGKAGECYILGCENLTYQEIFEKIANIIGVKPPAIAMPSFAVKAYGWLGTFMGAITGKAPQVSHPLARMACDDFVYSSQKAIRELGLPQTPLNVAIEDAITWFRQNGYLAAK